MDAAGGPVTETLNTLQKAIPTDWKKTRKDLNEIQTSWQTLNQNGLTMTAKDNFEAHTKMVENSIEMIRLAADESQMTLDPEVNGYYLVSPANFQIPVILEQLVVLRGSLSGMVASGSRSAANIGQAHSIVKTVRILNNDVLSSLNKVQEAGVVLPKEVIDMATKSVTESGDLTKLIDSINENPLAFTATGVSNQITANTQNTISLQDKLGQIFKQVLNQRIDTLTNDLILKSSEAGAVLLLAFFMGYVVFKSIGKNVRTLQQQTRSLSEGNLSTAILVNTSDELGKISAAVEQVRRSQNKILLELEEACTHLLTNTETLSLATEQVNTGAAEQSDSASAVASSVEELSVSVSQVAEYANQAHDLARSAGKSSTEGQKLVNNTRDAISQIAEASVEMARNIDSLGQRSEGISSIIQTIHAIAEQTNLLALNAAIEAARAGEQGRGFAVVADEVRQLSEKTAHSTQSISALVLGIQQDTKGAVEHVKSWKDKISKGIEDSEAASHSMAAISQNAQTTEHAVQEINEALSEQNSASQMIAQKVEKIAQMTEESQSAAKQVSNVSVEVKEVANHLQSLLAKFILDKVA